MTAAACHCCGQSVEKLGAPIAGLTDRQRDVLTAAAQFLDDWHDAPTVRELAILVGLKSTSTVQAHLEALEARGAIARNGKRGVTVTLDGLATVRAAGVERMMKYIEITVAPPDLDAWRTRLQQPQPR